MKNLKLKAARATMGLSQQALAELCGVSRQTMNAIEKGEYNPTIRLCRKICRILDKRLDDLFWEDDEDEENDDWAVKLDSSKNGYKPTIDNCLIILSHDKRLKKRIALNEFTKKIVKFQIGQMQTIADLDIILKKHTVLEEKEILMMHLSLQQKIMPFIQLEII